MTSLGWILFRKKKTPGTSAKSSLLTLRLDETATIRLQRWAWRSFSSLRRTQRSYPLMLVLVLVVMLVLVVNASGVFRCSGV